VRIGIDAGGTFTDFVVLHRGGRLETFKLRSTPRAPHDVILAGLARAAGDRRADVVHGSTVATNALLERKGAKTALVTTAGFEDLLEIGRQNRAALFDLTPPPKRLLIPRDLCFGVKERLHADGSVEFAPAHAALRRLRAALRRAKVESVAVCFLHAYRDGRHEALVREALAGLCPVSVSHEICPEFREYERASTTALNAYVGPMMRRYLEQLAASPHSIYVMQSNGGAMTLAEAARFSVRTILSGPAGGVAGAVAVGRDAAWTRVIGFDMGGTSTDVSLSDGAPGEAPEALVDGLPVKTPMLEIHTVGAGGGSLARVDAGGLLRVGPESAGADPGPACYGSGDRPTVTDAHVVLGRIAASQLAGGTLPIDPARARAAFGPLAQSLRLSVEETAAGVLRVANATMSRAIRVVSVERGIDPRGFALVAFGGCGGLHACEMAEELGLSTVLAPALAGSLSALGMLLADRIRDYAAGVLGAPDPASHFAALETQASAETPGARLERLADLRYQGQSYELTVPWSSLAAATRRFHEAHEKTYGYANPSRAVEAVTIRVRARRRAPKVPLAPRATALDHGNPAARRVFTGGRFRKTPVLPRAAMAAAPAAGPLLIVDYGSSLLVPPGWTASPAGAASLILRRTVTE
jgi:N-methylhydantoinase A